MVSNLDIYRSAHLNIREHGDAAVIKAAKTAMTSGSMAA